MEIEDAPLAFSSITIEVSSSSSSELSALTLHTASAKGARCGVDAMVRNLRGLTGVLRDVRPIVGPVSNEARPDTLR